MHSPCLPSASDGAAAGANPNPDRIAKAALLLLLALMAGLTWQKWGSLITDCGREMYLPTALLQGKRLYFDLWYPYGPLIPYWHALLFRVFGEHLAVLYAAGLSITATLTLVLYSLSRIFLPVSWSFVSAFTFLCVALQLSLFNYVLPYAYAAAYGALMIATLVRLLVKDPFTRAPGRMAVCGLLTGAAMLTKAEFGFAACTVLIFAMVLRGIASASSRSVGRTVGRDLLFGLPAPLAAAGVYAWLISQSSAEFMFGDNIPLLASSYFVAAFGTRWNERLGLSRSPVTLLKSVAEGIATFTIVAAALALCSASRFARRLCVAAVAALCGIHVLVEFAIVVQGMQLPAWLPRIAPRFLFYNRGMLWVSALMLIAGVTTWVRKRRVSPEQAAALLLAVAALATGIRVFTKLSPLGYSVFYSSLAFLAWLAAIRELTQRWQVSRSVVRGFCVALCCSIVASTWFNYATPEPMVRVGNERGSIYAEARTGAAFQEVLSFLEGAKSRSEKFVVWPEEAALYFFSGTLAPNRWYSLSPGLLPPGAKTADYLADLDRQNVRYVVLSNRATPEYGVPLFGLDYNQQVYQWLLKYFQPIKDIGPYQRVERPTHWGALIYDRK